MTKTPNEGPKAKSRKMPVQAVSNALESCEKLLAQAREKAKAGHRPKLSEVLVELGNQVLVAIETANAEFQKEVAPYLAALVQAHIDALFRIEERVGGGDSGWKQLERISQELGARLAGHEAIPYNPLELKHLANSTKAEFDSQRFFRLTEIEPFQGAGVYALYYDGDFPVYAPISAANKEKPCSWAIYVGEAGRQGKRKGIDLEGKAKTMAIYERLSDHHTESIKAVKNLKLEDFTFRCLPIQSLFVPLCEALLIETHKPLWNQLVDGFGNKHMGEARIDFETGQQITAWDLLHPGRENRATKPNKRFPNVQVLEEQIKKFLAGKREGVSVLSMDQAMDAATE